MTFSLQKPLVIPIFIPYSGCPHRCVFCNQAVLTGRKTPIPDASEIKRTILKYLKLKKPFRKPVEVSFFGGNFLGLDKDTVHALLESVQPFLKQSAVDGIRFSTRPDTISEKTLSFISDYPVSCIELGVQSMDDEILARNRRGHTSEDTKKAVFLIKKKGYRLGLQIMVGLPGDTRETTMATGKAISCLAPDFVRIYPTLVIEGSTLAAWYKKGEYSPIQMEDCIERVKSLYVMFSEKNIRVIRIGLQANEELDRGHSVLAGPYHPAFGHMVLSEIMFDKAVSLIGKNPKAIASRSIKISVHPSFVSRMQGLNKQNIFRMKKRFGFERIQIIADPEIPLDDISISGAD